MIRIARPRTLILLGLVAMAMAGLACGGKNNSGSVTAKSAPQMVEALKAKGLPIAGTQTYTAANDPNELLGRPGQYLSKTNFNDSRLPPSASFDTSAGGSVEVFASADEAGRREAYVTGIAMAAPLFAEYDFREGVALLRLSKSLTPEQAEQYRQALTELMR